MVMISFGTIFMEEKLKKTSDYAIITTACKKYIPDINAQLNSLTHVGNVQDVHLWYFEYPEWYLERLKNTDLGYRLILHEITESEARKYEGEASILLRKRFWYAGEIGKNYSGILVVDADICFVRNPIKFIEMVAKSGMILGTTKEQCMVYNDEHHKVKGKFLVNPTVLNDKDICATPLFIDAKKHERILKRSWEIYSDTFPRDHFKAHDMDALNICILEAGQHDNVIKLPNYSWLGTNESLLKPYTRACLRNGLIWSENGQETYSIHGQFYKKNWRDNQLANRTKCAKYYLGCNEKSNEIAKEAMNVLFSHWKNMCYKGRLKIKEMNYVNPGAPPE